ncbi:hypothetical protein SAMN05421823_11410 [Catalinimonas alkaloidigena]|uniref:Transcription elongation factor, GreA/GreB, C-term n=1 Tax=Catalinimonas alkaloidigena TaxID=1075417 RepID=A0A1G9TGD2_9BACT|nr:hypothetical protein [Catalinimonas alkaloidigena]SDM46730.1 hypothetical protein SAMN05421823_11410 [Catalinimonas alkaloidigena]
MEPFPTTALTLALKREIIEAMIQQQEAELTRLHTWQHQQRDAIAGENQDNAQLEESPLEGLLHDVATYTPDLDQRAEDLRALRALHPEHVHEQVRYGSLVRTNYAYFLVAVAVPKRKVAGVRVYGISTGSPLFQKMEGLRKGAEFHLGAVEYVILDLM